MCYLLITPSRSPITPTSNWGFAQTGSSFPCSSSLTRLSGPWSGAGEVGLLLGEGPGQAELDQTRLHDELVILRCFWLRFFWLRFFWHCRARYSRTATAGRRATCAAWSAVLYPSRRRGWHSDSDFGPYRTSRILLMSCTDDNGFAMYGSPRANMGRRIS